MKSVLEDIKNQEYKQAYLFFGEEGYLKKQYRNKLLQAWNPLLDHRSAFCAGGLPGVPPGSWKALSFPENAGRRRQSKTNVHSTRESRKGSSFFFAIFI